MSDNGSIDFSSVFIAHRKPRVLQLAEEKKSRLHDDMFQRLNALQANFMDMRIENFKNSIENTSIWDEI